MRYRVLISLILLLAFSSCSIFLGGKDSGDLSPLSFGLRYANSGVERYNVLLETHKEAVRRGVNVNYNGIKKIELDIPKNAQPIPLTQYNDFKQCVFVVRNRQKMVYLFEAHQEAVPISILKAEIDVGDFRLHPGISRGAFLLIIEDKKPWVDNRKGYNYGHIRKDILLLNNGIAQNRVVMPYNNKESSPSCSYVKIDAVPFIVKNLIIKRTEDCTAITNVMYISGKDDVQISNLTLQTPDNNWRNDRAIRIDNCTNVHFEDVTIDGTYSQEEHSGYGISFDNIWNFTADRIVGHGKWGIFGTNNVNTVYIVNSSINRFDIHCYGCNVSFLNVDFSDKYNQLNSVYGDIVFNQCTFTRFDPIRVGSSYNAYVPCDVYFNDCVFYARKENNVLLRLGENDSVVNTRKELENKCWPNVYINNLRVIMDRTINDFVIVYTKIEGKEAVSKIDYISKIIVDGLHIYSSNDIIQFSLTPKPVKTLNKVECILHNVTVNDHPIEGNSSVKMRTNLPLKNGTIDFSKRYIEESEKR